MSQKNILKYMENVKINRGNFESNKIFVEKIGILSGDKKILEIGSGCGAMLDYLKRRGFDVVGTEINEEYIGVAKKEFDVDLLNMGGEDLKFPDHSFDIVISFDVFEHIPDTVKHLSEVRRVLKKGGYYILQTPNKITNIPFEIIKEKSFTKYKKYHCSLFTYRGLQKMFSRNGFEVEFVMVPIVNDYFREKIKKHFGGMGLSLLNILNPDKLPIFLQTNFYIIAKFK